MSDDLEQEELVHQINTQSENPSERNKEYLPRKKWKEYFLEFLMLFFAVSLGFFADSIRESISDKAKEKEYIISMIEDVNTDKTNIRNEISLNNLIVQHLDSLGNICINYNASIVNDADIYQHYMYGLIHPDFINPTERTIQQLKNAGGMRLIKNKTAVDAIILYDDKTKKLADQQVYYELYQNNSIDLGVQLFNFQKFGFGVSASQAGQIEAKNDYFSLINNDKSKLIEFGNIILVYEGVVIYYSMLLQELNSTANEVINTLEKEYNLE